MSSRRLFVASLAVLVTAVLASASTGAPPGGSPPGLAKAIEAQERHQDQLLETPGIVGTGVGLNRSGHPVIRIYTTSRDVGVPASLDAVPVERVATGIVRARATPTDRFPRPVPIGVSSGHPAITAGTLGARVTNGTNVYALSNNHVYANINSASIGAGVIQPGTVDGGSDPTDRIGTLAAFEQIKFDGSDNTIDAAIALTSIAEVGTATPSDGYGTPSPVTAPAYVGQQVQKYGRTTGLQLGAVSEVNVTIDVCYLFIPPTLCLQEARFVQQVGVTPDTFSAGGDSGSLIVTQGGNQPVALLFAGGDGRTVGNPIDLVLQRFGITIDGSVTPDGPPSAPVNLAALAGDASVSLTWSAPTFDGGSAISKYKVYRGTSPGSETFLANAGSATSYVDASAANGTTYSYKVSAENAVGEGPLSSAASATPSDLVAPVLPLPILDSFDRANENPLSDGGKWGNGVLGTGENGLYVTSNVLACTRTSTCTGWRSNLQYGPDSESWARISTLPGVGNAVRLYVRMQSPGSSAVDGYMLLAAQASGTDQVTLYRVTNGALTSLLTVGQELQAGDTLLLRAEGSRLEAWRFDGAAWSRYALLTDTTYPAAGYVGVGLRGTSGRLDDFGGRTINETPPPPEPPSAPVALTAQGLDSLVRLTWQSPVSDGGSSVTGYRIYRGEAAGGTAYLASVGTVTSYEDTTVVNGSTYYYTVTAENAAGEGLPSPEVIATPTDVAPPAEPLPVIDGFNRANESPLFDGAKWRNGVLGSGERSLKVASNLLAGSKTSTTTAWRSSAQFGPTTEAYATVATLPGNGNAFRLYVRLQTPGSSAVDGYMLIFTQASGTDSFTLYRITNGSLTSIASAGTEVAVGNRLLLRASGSALEAWVYAGSTWTRVVRTTDATYAAAGYTGVGIRGKTGRLDDFGAR